MKSIDSVIVSWDFSHGKDVGVLIVGHQKNGRVEVINAYQGEEAHELYERIISQKKTQKTSFTEGRINEFSV